MRKGVFGIVLILTLGMGPLVYGADSSIFDMRNTLLNESREIKSLLGGAKDTVLLNTIWDACIMTISQIDAYFYMTRIFNTIEKENLKEDAVVSIIDWLNEIRKTNELNVKNLVVLKVISETSAADGTKIHMARLEQYFSDINNLIEKELEKISPLKILLQKK